MGGGRAGGAAGRERRREIGRGAQNAVYQVRRGSDYAMKVLLDAAESDTASRAAFRREAALLAGADHPQLAVRSWPRCTMSAR